MAVCATAALSVSAASRQQPIPPRHAQQQGCPTHLDYVVLASMADSGNWVGLSTYRLERPTRWEFTPGSGLQNVLFATDRVAGDCRSPREPAREQSG